MAKLIQAWFAKRSALPAGMECAACHYWIKPDEPYMAVQSFKAKRGKMHTSDKVVCSRCGEKLAALFKVE